MSPAGQIADPAELADRCSLRRPLSGFSLLALILVCTWLASSVSVREPVAFRARVHVPAESRLPASEAVRLAGTPHVVEPTDSKPQADKRQPHATEMSEPTAGNSAPSPSSALVLPPHTSVAASPLASDSSLSITAETPTPAIASPQAAPSSPATNSTQAAQNNEQARQSRTQSQHLGGTRGFAALRRSITDDLHNKAPVCEQQGAQAPDPTLPPVNSADAARATATVALCQTNRQPSAELNAFLQAFLRLQAQLREPGNRGSASTPPPCLQGAIAWQWISGGGGLADQLKGMLAALAASLLSPRPAPFYLMLQPTTMPAWVPADVDWRLSPEEARTIAGVPVQLVEEVPGVSYVRRGNAELQLPTPLNPSESPATNNSVAISPHSAVQPAVATVSVAHVALANDAGQVGDKLIRPVLRESSNAGITLVRSNTLGPSVASAAAWPPGRCPAAWYATRAHGSSAPTNGVPQAAALGSSNMSISCLAHIPKELQCWFLQTEVSRLQREKQKPNALLQGAVQEACAAEGAAGVGEAVSPPWFSGARLLYGLLDAMVNPSPVLTQRIAAAISVGSPSVHVLQPQLLLADSQTMRSSPAANTASGSPDTSSESASSRVSVFSPGRQYVIGIHLRLGDVYFRGGDVSGQVVQHAASLAAHCASIAAAELSRRYGPRESVIWIVASDNPQGRAHLLHLAAHLHENETATTTSNALLRPSVAAVVSLANETAHVDMLAGTDPALRDALSLDAYAEHALLSAAHAIVKTYSGFSRSAAVLGNVPLVLDIKPGTASSANGFGLSACAETTALQGWSEEGQWWKRRRLRNWL